MVEAGRVVDEVRPGVAMAVELDQRQRPVLGDMRLQQRIGDPMVAAERQHGGTGIEDRRGVGDDRAFEGRRQVVVEVAIAGVDHRQRLDHVEPPRERLQLGEAGARLADAARPEPGARPVGCRVVERDAGNDDIGAGVVGRVRQLEERAEFRRTSAATARRGCPATSVPGATGFAAVLLPRAAMSLAPSLPFAADPGCVPPALDAM